MGLPEDVK